MTKHTPASEAAVGTNEAAENNKAPTEVKQEVERRQDEEAEKDQGTDETESECSLPAATNQLRPTQTPRAQTLSAQTHYYSRLATAVPVQAVPVQVTTATTAWPTHSCPQAQGQLNWNFDANGSPARPGVRTSPPAQAHTVFLPNGTILPLLPLHSGVQFAASPAPTTRLLTAYVPPGIVHGYDKPNRMSRSNTPAHSAFNNPPSPREQGEPPWLVIKPTRKRIKATGPTTPPPPEETEESPPHPDSVSTADEDDGEIKTSETIKDGVPVPMGTKRKRQRDAQRRYRAKKRRTDLTIKKELDALKREQLAMEPLRQICETQMSNVQPMFWSLVLRVPEKGKIQVLKAWKHHEALGYGMVGKTYADFIRSSSNGVSWKAYMDQVIARFNLQHGCLRPQDQRILAEQQVKVAIYEKKKLLQDGQFSWSWVQCVCKVLSQPRERPVIAHIAEMDVHDAMTLGMAQAKREVSASASQNIDARIMAAQRKLAERQTSLIETNTSLRDITTEIGNLTTQIDLMKRHQMAQLQLQSASTMVATVPGKDIVVPQPRRPNMLRPANGHCMNTNKRWWDDNR